MIVSSPRRIFLLAVLTIGALGRPVAAMGPSRHHGAESLTGLACWYGADQGRQTASGERFDQDELTAAHRTLPFCTIVRVTDQLNGRTVDVRINDRGPWVDGRIIDLSSAAADVLQMKQAGTVPVTLEILHLGSPGRPIKE